MKELEDQIIAVYSRIIMRTYNRKIDVFYGEMIIKI